VERCRAVRTGRQAAHRSGQGPDVGLTFIVGGQRNALRIVPDPARLAAISVPLGNVIEAVSQANRSLPGRHVREGGQAVSVTAGQTLKSAEELGS
jgi:multidrug efflux pump subunit AcrB